MKLYVFGCEIFHRILTYYIHSQIICYRVTLDFISEFQEYRTEFL